MVGGFHLGIAAEDVGTRRTADAHLPLGLTDDHQSAPAILIHEDVGLAHLLDELTAQTRHHLRHQVGKLRGIDVIPVLAPHLHHLCGVLGQQHRLESGFACLPFVAGHAAYLLQVIESVHTQLSP